MEKLNRVPKHIVKHIRTESYEIPNDYSNSNKLSLREKYKFKTIIEIEFDLDSDETILFTHKLYNEGLEFIATQGLNLEKFKYVINQGYVKLPILLKHPDKEIAQLAWILSKYFSMRHDIMPEQVIE